MDGIILINKEKGMTSHDVVNMARRSLHTKKVGHCGTLDPDATGVLVLCINKATKALQFLQSDEKEYIATLALGTSTDTYDASGKVIEEKTFTGIDHVEEVFQSFLGIQQQIPPMYSSIKVNGRKLYEYARNGESVDIPPRTIEIKDIEILDIFENLIRFRVHCSKGTYIRSLCVDIAKQLGYPGHMVDLIRSKSGKFSLEQCNSIDELKNGKVNFIDLDLAFDGYETFVVDDESDVLCGRKIVSDIDHDVFIRNKDGHVLAVYGPDGQGNLKCIRGLF